MISFSFYISGKVFISPSILDRLSDIIFLVSIFFFFRTLNISFHLRLAFKFSAEKYADNLIGAHLYVMSPCFLAPFKIFSGFDFWHFAYCVPQCVLLLVYSSWNPLSFLTLDVYCLPQIWGGGFSQYFFKHVLSVPHVFFISFSFFLM